MQHGVEVTRLDAVSHGVELIFLKFEMSDVAITWRRARRHRSRCQA